MANLTPDELLKMQQTKLHQPGERDREYGHKGAIPKPTPAPQPTTTETENEAGPSTQNNP